VVVQQQFCSAKLRIIANPSLSSQIGDSIICTVLNFLRCVRNFALIIAQISKEY